MAARDARAAGGQTADYRILGANTPASQSLWTAAFVQRLRELGWSEGHNIAIEYRWAEGRPDRSAEIAAEFARLKVDVIATSGTSMALAAKQATSTTPIVFATAGDPVGTGLVPPSRIPAAMSQASRSSRLISALNVSNSCARSCLISDG